MNPYNPPRIRRPHLFRNPILSQLACGALPLRLFALVGRFSPPGHVIAGSQDIQSVGGPQQAPVASGDSAGVNTKPITIVIMDEEWLNRTPTHMAGHISVDFIPTVLTYSPVSSINPIKVVGANNPPYHFGGSEDTLTIKIDWYGYLNEPVIEKCRFIESLCKADGWSQGPPEVKVYWGETNRLFRDHSFVVTKAPYTMRTFMKHKRLPNQAGFLFSADPLSTSANIIAKRSITQPYHLWPIHATQVITMKRITDHQLTHEEIRQY